MKIVAYGASTSSTSINKALATYTAGLVDGAEVKVLDINDYDVPMFSEDLEKEIGQADGAKEFLNDLADADAFVISYAEHNGHYPAAYKNLFDWATRIDRELFKQKPAVYLATSPGPSGAKSVLAAAEASAPFYAANVKATVSVPGFYDKFDTEAGKATDEALITELKAAAAKLAG
ncbi:MAG: NAD(P)H-dependent oxidoreductase [Pseudomonadota bacterium]|uniref:NADPH-dependent FMN reductase n=1 Tax=Alteromonas alba TaxID=2079529 RepID=A0A2S9VFW9_9ALTE|nr:NAD(P)H-dependent oxidoreductase [Alteromonas alba]MCP4862418.1 NAD(P)H-dependent oxidoreductase [Alteromonas sp.]MDY6926700.1 NAD(P)H-dependent oxidoreductase [Pseudomonadota bacterium]PRO75324.1 NADPH-dependent FMN reductase [Alteromonas alba]|tara:strand:- start:1360 stop:1887 length:528 start_codon:yes stop_codon:yes gene_type:complete